MRPAKLATKNRAARSLILTSDLGELISLSLLARSIHSASSDLTPVKGHVTRDLRESKSWVKGEIVLPERRKRVFLPRKLSSFSSYPHTHQQGSPLTPANNPYPFILMPISPNTHFPLYPPGPMPIPPHALSPYAHLTSYSSPLYPSASPTHHAPQPAFIPSTSLVAIIPSHSILQ